MASQPVGRYRLTVKDLPLDGYWSAFIYNKDGYFQENQCNSYSVNSVTFGPEPGGLDNFLYVIGWLELRRSPLPATAGDLRWQLDFP